jgi:hypothetical protein
VSSHRSPVLLITALCFALLGGCSRGAPELGNASTPPSSPEGGMQGTGDGGDANGMCPAAGFAADRPLLGWSDGAAINLLYRNGEVRQVQPIATSSPAPTTGIAVLWLKPGRDGWSVAYLRASEATDETSQMAILRPDGSTLWRGKLQRPYPEAFAGPHGSVIDVGEVLVLIDENGNAVERKEDVPVHALGAVGAAGEVPVSWEERPTGEVIDHPGFVQPAGARTELPAVRRYRWVLIGETFHYLEQVNGDLVWQRQGLTSKETVLRVPNTADGKLDHYGAWVVLSTGFSPIAVAREDGSDARLLQTRVPASPPTYNTSANGDWLVGSAEFGAPIWRLNIRTGTVDDLSSSSFGTRRIFDASFCTPPLVTDAQGRMLLGLRDDSLGGLFREVSGQAGTWEAMGRPVRGVIYIKVTAWGDTVVASAETGEDTFCPDKFGQWPDQTDNSDVLGGASVQLFHPNVEPRLLTTDLVMHQSGTCALMWTPGASAEILEVPTGTTHGIPASPLRPIWLQ